MKAKQGIVLLDSDGKVLRSYNGVHWTTKLRIRIFLFLRLIKKDYK